MIQRGFLSPLLIASIAAAVVIGGLGIALKVQSARLKSEQDDHKATQAKFEAFVSDTKRIGQEAQTKADAEKIRQKGVSDASVKSLEGRLAHINRAYASLRDNRSSAGGRGAAPLSDAARTVPTDAQQIATRLLERVEIGVLGVIEAGDKEIAKLHELWEWNQQVGKGRIGVTGGDTPATPDQKR